MLSAVFAFAGSIVGAKLAISLGENLRYVILGAVPFATIAAFITPKKRKKQIIGNKLYVYAAIIGLIIGT